MRREGEMARIIAKDSYYPTLKIEFQRYHNKGFGSENAARQEAGYLIQLINRHCNLDFGSELTGYSVDVESFPICEFCKHRWAEKSGTYNGGCCAEDEKNNPEITGKLTCLAT
jgi:hypothetical protein